MEKKLEIDYILVCVVLIINAFSIFTLYSIDVDGNRWSRQLLHTIVSLGVCYFFARLNYQELSRQSIMLYGISLLLLLLTLIPGIGSEVKGARSWLRFGDIGFQASALANLTVIILLARYFQTQGMDTDKLRSLYISFGIVILPMMLIIAQPDLGGAVFYVVILFLLLFLAGGNLLHLSSILLFSFVVVFIPLYIGYFRIILLQPLIDQFADLGNTDLVRLVEIVGSDIWQIVDEKTSTWQVDVAKAADAKFLTKKLADPDTHALLSESVRSVRIQNGGYLLMLAENRNLLVWSGVSFCLLSGVLWGVNYFRGSIGLLTKKSLFVVLKRIFIITAIAGTSLIVAGTISSVVRIQLHQVARITAFINPEQFSRDLAYQIRASRVAIGSGELIGRGFSEANMTRGKRPLVPEVETDFIFSAWSERTGFLGSLFLILCYSILLVRSFFISMTASDRFGTLLGSGISCMFFYYTLINIGIALGLLPVTGLPLTFFSYGGSHLLSSYIGIGILLSIYTNRHRN